MSIASALAVVVVALLHLWFLVLEMFLWDKPLGRKVFRMSPEQAAQTKRLAMNQGLYNGFLAAGLLWGEFVVEGGRDVTLFFLGCVVVAGVFGAATAGRAILFVQAAPAALAVALVLLR
jgi:putative membrane protein